MTEVLLGASDWLHPAHQQPRWKGARFSGREGGSSSGAMGKLVSIIVDATEAFNSLKPC